MKTLFYKYLKNNIVAAALYNFLIVMAIYMLSRFVFYWVNLEYFKGISAADFALICFGGLRFDLAGAIYINLLYALMMVIPFHFRDISIYQKIAKWVFVVTNSIAFTLNSIDMIYFKFTTRRTTSTIFSEFSHENNITKVFGESMLQYWYIVVFIILTVFLLIKLYYTPKVSVKSTENKWIYYIRNIIAMLLVVTGCIGGIRGGLGHYVRPITLSNANQYISKPLESSIVLNTPFCLIRTIGKTVYKDPKFFSEEELPKIYEPVIKPHPNGGFKNLNVVVFIMESFSKEFVGELNKNLDNGKYKGYTPFLDSLIRQGLTFEYSYANGRKSIDAMPSVLSSIPMFYEPYFVTPYSNNKISGIANELNTKGYYTAFFHGAPNGSMGFQAYAKASGFKDYYGMTEYNNDKDFDGTWAIWDEEFFQFYANKMNSFKQPFMTALFSASSHHPFVIPDKYVSRYPEAGGHPIHKCVEYTDNALREFFKTASKQAWFNNTLFVITADHTNALTKKEYLTDEGLYKVPIILFQPESNLKGRIKDIAEQIDIMPTILGYLNYDKPFVAFGKDVLDPNYKNHYAVNYCNQIVQYIHGNYLLQFDGQKASAIFNIKNDPYLKNNLVGKLPSDSINDLMTKAIVQQYLQRMIKNQLTVSK